MWARPKEITVEYTNLEGKIVKKRFVGWEARAIMHENDHLNGVLFIDCLDKEDHEKFDPFIQRLHHRIHDGTELKDADKQITVAFCGHHRGPSVNDRSSKIIENIPLVAIVHICTPLGHQM